MKHLYNFIGLVAKALVGALIFTMVANASIKDYAPKVHTKVWNAKWSGDENYNKNDYRVLHFRRTFDLEKVPESFKINVSADNRFALYVNGKLVGRGPARGDMFNWYYDTFDIAPYLKSGKNVIASLVWHAGNGAPYAQFTRKIAFILDGATKAEDIVSTPKNWKVKESKAYSPRVIRGLFTGPSDIIDGSKYDWGWTSTDFDDSKWKFAIGYEPAHSVDSLYGEINYMLTPRKIPQMEETQMRLQKICKVEGIENVSNFISGKDPFTIPANTKCRIFIDNGFQTTAYPILKIDGGKGSVIDVKFGEALFDKNNQKANRNDVEGRDFEHRRLQMDTFISDGGANREYSSLWFRTYRYVGVDIQTKDQPLTIKDFYGNFTAYPFVENASFDSDQKSIAKIWEVGWRTARLCANETYYDCPYYEQLQYVGDTRIQALISLYVSGDDRLMRQAISAFNASRSYVGITKARYPSRVEQHIPPFSLYWILMLNDYAMHRDDLAYIRENLQGVYTILDWFTSQLDTQKNILKPRMPYWNFVDWSASDPKTKGKNSTGWYRGVAPESATAGSAITTLHLALTFKEASKLMRKMGDESLSKKYADMHAKIVKAVKERCWNEKRQLFMDFEGAISSSQHVNIMAILSDAIEPEKQPSLMKKIIEDKSLTQCTFYYRFYLTEAMRKCGLGNLYIDNLKPWYDMINIGLTTFAENPEPTRSDCHAWSSSPNYHLLSLVCGVMPADYGFKKVRIEPNLGSLNEAFGKVPHPAGNIEVAIRKNEYGKLDANITLPTGVDGVFVFKGQEIELKSGKNNISLRK